MAPTLDPESYAFCLLPAGGIPPTVEPVAVVREAEGVTLVLTTAAAAGAGLVAVFLARRITLTIHSDLAAVGFLAAIATRLAEQGIPCNLVAGIHHDHLFLPPELAESAMDVLRALEAESRQFTGGPVSYQVRISLEAPLAEEWFDWMRAVHLPEVLATGCFRSGSIWEEQEPAPPPGRRVFRMEYVAGSLERFREYQSRHAPALQQAHTARYAGRFEASRSIARLRAPLAE